MSDFSFIPPTSVVTIPGAHASAAFTSKTSEVFKEEHNIGAPDKPCGEAVQTLTQNCCQTIHEEWYVFDSFHLCTEAFDL